MGACGSQVWWRLAVLITAALHLPPAARHRRPPSPLYCCPCRARGAVQRRGAALCAALWCLPAAGAAAAALLRPLPAVHADGRWVLCTPYGLPMYSLCTTYCLNDSGCSVASRAVALRGPPGSPLVPSNLVRIGEGSARARAAEGCHHTREAGPAVVKLPLLAALRTLVVTATPQRCKLLPASPANPESTFSAAGCIFKSSHQELSPLPISACPACRRPISGRLLCTGVREFLQSAARRQRAAAGPNQPPAHA
jgi:hypothetical protein